MKEHKLITIINGEKIEYDIIIQFTSNKTQKKYVAYTDYSKDSEGNCIIYIATYNIDPKNKEIYILSKITDKEEIEMVKNILSDMKDLQSKKQ